MSNYSMFGFLTGDQYWFKKIIITNKYNKGVERSLVLTKWEIKNRVQKKPYRMKIPKPYNFETFLRNLF